MPSLVCGPAPSFTPASPNHVSQTPPSASTEVHGDDQTCEPLSSAALQGRVRRASAWTSIGHGAGQLLRLLNNLILWHLLAPEVFGLMALVNACLTGLGLFSDLGLGPSIVQSARGNDPKYLNTAWTLQIGRGVLISLAACLLAWPMAALYRQPQFAYLLLVISLSPFIMGFYSTRVFTAARKMALGHLSAINLVSQTAGIAVMIVGAWLYHSIWAIVAGMLVSSALYTIWSHTFLPGIRNRFQWDAASARSLLHFGGWIFLSTSLTFLAGQSDRLVFGRMIPMAMLGVYSIATTFVAMSQTLASQVFSSVLFPVLSRLHGEKADLSATFLRIRKPWLLLCGCTAACFVAGGPTLIRLLYKSNAYDAGWIMQILSGAVWLVALANTNENALLAMGLPKWLAAGNAGKLAGMVLLIPIGFWSFGFPGAVAGIAASEILKYSVSVLGTRRRKLKGLAQDFRLSLLVVVTSAIGLSVAHWIAPLLRDALSLPARIETLLEGIMIFLGTAPLWGAVFLLDRSRRRRQ